MDGGTSGGVWGLDRGYSLMIGGDPDAVAQVDPIFVSLAPGVQGSERTPGREGDVAPAENGYLRCGPSGAGHFVKMVHDGIECGDDGRDRRGAEHPAQGEHRRQAPKLVETPRPRRWPIRSTTVTT